MDYERLNKKLYEQLERISEPKLSKEALSEEVERAKAMALLASQMIAGETLKMRQEIVEKQINAKRIAGYIE